MISFQISGPRIDRGFRNKCHARRGKKWIPHQTPMALVHRDANPWADVPAFKVAHKALHWLSALLEVVSVCHILRNATQLVQVLWFSILVTESRRNNNIAHGLGTKRWRKPATARVICQFLVKLRDRAGKANLYFLGGRIGKKVKRREKGLIRLCQGKRQAV